MAARCEVLRVDPAFCAVERTGTGPIHGTERHDAGLRLAIERAADVMLAGGLVAFPTETVYGLGAPAYDGAAVDRVFAAKGRPAHDPLIVHLARAGDAAQVVMRWDEVAARLAAAFWPGPLSLVLPRSTRVPDNVVAGGPAVAVRVPAHPVARALIEAVGTPVAAPSANRFGRVSPTTAGHVVEELGDRIDLVLDGGPTPLGVESTVVDLTGDVPTVRRPGGVTLEDLRAVVPNIVALERQSLTASSDPSAPGELLAHYAPATPVVLVEAAAGVVGDLVELAARMGVTARQLVLDPDPQLAARGLYGALRAADRDDTDVLLAVPVDPTGIGRAVNDRLYRAAHGRIVTDAAPDSLDRVVAAATGAPRNTR